VDGASGQEDTMNKSKHLTSNDRSNIQQYLTDGRSFKHMARELGKDPSTFSKEIRSHIQFKKTGCYGRPFNSCLIRKTCPVRKLCGNLRCNGLCKFCTIHPCSRSCPDYQLEICKKLSSPPYVCNGCKTRSSCTLEKRMYTASDAQKEYEETRSEARQGLQITEKEALRLDNLISPLLLKGQSLHHVCVNHADEIMYHERTLYHYVDRGIFSARNIHMPRLMRMGKRKPKKSPFKVDRKCRIGRTYIDYQNHLAGNPGLSVVEMDSVEGCKGGKVLLTLHFVVPQLMLAFIRDANTSQSVIDAFNTLDEALEPEVFKRLFQVVLGDNGSEFSNPGAIEADAQGNSRTKVFYCDPSAPYQKGAIENNHTLLRRIIPKGTPLDAFTQEDINLMMNHVNSYTRQNLGDKSPYDVFAALFGEETLKKMNAEHVPPDMVTLRPSLLK